MNKEVNKPNFLDSHLVIKSFIFSTFMWIIIEMVGVLVEVLIQNHVSYIPKIGTGLIAVYVAYMVAIFTFEYKYQETHFVKNLFTKLQIKKPELKRTIIIICISVIAYTLTSIAQYLLLKLFPTTSTSNQTTQELLSNSLGVWKPFISIICPIIISPFFEEIIFRGMIGSWFNILNNKKYNIIYILLQSVIFGLMHIQLTGSTFSIISAITMPMISGAVFGFVYLKTKNLTYSIITHSTYNIITIILQSLI